MVADERTQIGIFKALGYSNRAIINKYLFYSGSAAVVGCGLGVLVGSVVFPKILWAAYGIILSVTPDIVLKLNWPLCIVVVTAYTIVSMLVTWYCCRRELREVPAELMRPRAPTAGKKIWMEYLPFWDKISFLNKVMFRNVFRYRQRMLMMLLGVGGCTALLLTGFGLRDSITGIADYQFKEVTVYDMAIYFTDGRTAEQQQSFRDALSLETDKIHFVHQASMELDFDSQTKEIYMIVSDDGIQDHMDFHHGNQALTMPGEDETLVSAGIAETMGIREGDTITLRNSDMQTLNLTVAGIYDNYVNNYVIIRPETVEKQWNETPASQMAFIKVAAGLDVHEVSAKITGMNGVMNVTISQDVAGSVSSMLDALDLVVITIVICAGMLAVIVLYNLTNISITERIREIATIKVLGFNSKESAAYVFKENLLLSGMGAMLGLVGGHFLLKFVMSQIKIDMVWLQARPAAISFLWAVLLTMVSTCLVDFLLYFKLEKINMAEALKSVE
jgi:putative ABC transport system permease protein